MDERTTVFLVLCAVFGAYAIIIWLLIVANSKKDDEIDSRYREHIKPMEKHNA